MLIYRHSLLIADRQQTLHVKFASVHVVIVVFTEITFVLERSTRVG